jgi:prepilin-type processing-associated H-X9-DG protein
MWSDSDGMSGYYEILPHLELKPLYDSINLAGRGTSLPIGLTPKSEANSTAFRTKVAHFVCPSDDFEVEGSSPVSYRFNVGNSTPGMEASSPKLGAFDLSLPATPAAFRDGLSNTVGFSERLIGGQDEQSFDRTRDLWGAGVLDLFPISTDDDVRKVCATLSGQPPAFTPVLGRSWMFGGPLHAQYNHVMTPNPRPADCGAGSMNSQEIRWCEYCAISARSHHPGGVNAALMDGSVRFITNGVALPIWRALATRAGGEPIPAEF